MKRTLVLTCLIAGLSPIAALAWIPDDCGPDQKQAIAEHRRLFEKEVARPGGIPSPYPTSQDQVLSNLKAELQDQLSPEVEKTTVGDGFAQKEDGARFLEIWGRGDLRFEVLEEENWTPTRCAPSSDLSTMHLVRAWQVSKGTEILRAALGRDGHLSQWTFNFGKDRNGASGVGGEVKSLPEANAALKEILGPELEGLQYIAVSGRGIRCPPLSPCLVARNATGLVALVNGGRRFRFDSKSARLEHSVARQGVMPPQSPPSAVLMTIGSRLAVVAEEIP